MRNGSRLRIFNKNWDIPVGLVALGIFINRFLFTRKIHCPRCGEMDEAPSLMVSCDCQNCGRGFDIVAGRVSVPRSWIKFVWDWVFGLFIVALLIGVIVVSLQWK